MTEELNAEIVAIGTELLLGDITDTNSVFIARTLRDLGINLFFSTHVGDNEKRIESALRIALGRAQIVITCGGLGPTIDDMTRQAVAAATDRGLTFHQELLDQIAERFKGFRSTMTENNKRQAYVPDNSVVIENPVGTAPSFAVEVGDQVIISLPGVPREMKFLLIEKVVPYLRQRYGITTKVIKERILKAAGIGESALDDAIGVELLEASNPTVGLAAHSGQIDVRIAAKADSSVQADAMIAVVEKQIRDRVGEYIFGADADTIEQALINALKEQNGSLVIGEVGIDPVLSGRFKTALGAAEMLKTVVTYPTPQALADDLGADAATPLRQLAEQTAEYLYKQHNVSAALVVVSYPDAREDHDDSSEGSAIAVYVDGKLRSRSYGFGGGTDTAQEWTGTWTMSMAWRMLRERVES